jgi:hypothetical protein
LGVTLPEQREDHGGMRMREARNWLAFAANARQLDAAPV